MLDQVYLFENLGFQPDGVAAVKKVLEQRRRHAREENRRPQEVRAAVREGRRRERPHDRQAGRSDERFPPRKEAVVREQIARQAGRVEHRRGRSRDLRRARGADILFAELCADRGAEVWLMLPLPERLSRGVSAAARHATGKNAISICGSTA